MKQRLTWTVLLSCLLGVLSCAQAEITVASIFGNNMVLQQEKPVPVWGKASPGETVTVRFGQRTARTVADANGTWQVRLKPLKANASPTDLVVTGTNTLTFANVLVGEVWVCSGQSNMEWAHGGSKEQAEAEPPQIRMFTVAHAPALTPQTSCRGSWAVCSTNTAGSFSAVGYYFARELHAKLKVPVGMINASYGGTRAEPWTSLPGLKALPSFHRQAEQFERGVTLGQTDRAQFERERDAAVKDTAARRAVWYRTLDAKDPGLKQRWMAPDADVSAWRDVVFPCPAQNSPLGSFVGSVWCRKEVEIPAAWVGKPLTLHLGVIDETDDCYVNDTHVGRTWFEVPEFWKVQRVYPVPGTAITTTKVSVTVRVLNLYFDLGLLGPADEMKLVLKDAPETIAVSLTGHWRYTDALAITHGEIPQPPPATPPVNGAGALTALFNGMINPLIPYAIRGVIWYQGESNASADAYPEYHELFTGLITSWRQAWGEGDFPFAFVQLANFMAPQTLPVEKASWAELRQAQTDTLALRNTTMAVIIDLGEADNIHPRNKQDVGKRLALGVLAKTYDQPIPLYSGPRYRSMKIEGRTIRIQFDFAQGLACRDERLASFAVAGADKMFHSADARIDGETVVVSCDQVDKPVAVRYGWASNPHCRLVNAADLPAAPFKTDSWADFGVQSDRD